ncbi:hypothetical protein K435DRAFT_867262 [Dendrothele bispora CBS 962.96]|uniref:Uncharacterized protein n=1 Tax=Dendrothele bispora (strain CBS 962.96) TaxID=1314807 RepID=A0A4S8LES0_DENBC|nr:hypothetical protein K435DRAFT_867262 [Dendrothele bispora CBS 962.96]
MLYNKVTASLSEESINGHRAVSERPKKRKLYDSNSIADTSQTNANEIESTPERPKIGDNREVLQRQLWSDKEGMDKLVECLGDQYRAWQSYSEETLISMESLEQQIIELRKDETELKMKNSDLLSQMQEAKNEIETLEETNKFLNERLKQNLAVETALMPALETELEVLLRDLVGKYEEAAKEVAAISLARLLTQLRYAVEGNVV